MTLRALHAIALLLLASAPLGAQSLFNAAGIGMPMEALDGRARALGSVGIGLSGTSFLPADPAAPARLPVPGALMVAEPSWVDLTRDGTSGHRYFRGNRFPLFAAGYPVRGGMATLSATSILDQGYRGSRAITVDLGGAPTEATDEFRQIGSVSALSLGYARALTPTTSVGMSAGRYAGSVLRDLVRQFGDSASANQVLPYGSGGSWRYSGYQLTAGVSTDFGTILRVAASATWSTDLDAEPTGQTSGAARSFHIPLQLRLGATSQLAPGVMLSASVARADWSGTQRDLLGAVRASSATAFGAGVELGQARLFGRTTPLRLGFRRRGLPFALDGNGAHEQALSGGFGFALNETNEIVLAGLDLGVERGFRKDGAYREDFWRATFSLRVSGF
jgi:hypothetical protein